MILGRMGNLPGELAPEILQYVKEKELEFYTGNPQDAYPDALPEYRAEMEANGWELGQDEEELFELAMHDRQYRDYKSGVAKQRFEQELEQAKTKAGAPIFVSRPVIEVPSFDVDALLKAHPTALPIQTPCAGQLLWQIDVADVSTAPAVGTVVKRGESCCWIQSIYGLEAIPSVCDGRLIQIDVPQGGRVQKGQVIAFIEP